MTEYRRQSARHRANCTEDLGAFSPVCQQFCGKQQVASGRLFRDALGPDTCCQLRRCPLAARKGSGEVGGRATGDATRLAQCRRARQRHQADLQISGRNPTLGRQCDLTCDSTRKKFTVRPNFHSTIMLTLSLHSISSETWRPLIPIKRLCRGMSALDRSTRRSPNVRTALTVGMQAKRWRIYSLRRYANLFLISDTHLTAYRLSGRRTVSTPGASCGLTSQLQRSRLVIPSRTTLSNK